MADIIFGLDIGTTKVCALVGEVREGRLQIIGLGLAPARGMRKGMVIDVSEKEIRVRRAVVGDKPWPVGLERERY